MDRAPGRPGPVLPLHIALAWQQAEEAVASGRSGAEKHNATLTLADALTCHLGAVAVAQYSQALLTGEIEADPTLNRSLRNLRRVLTGQWLGWTARALECGVRRTKDGDAERGIQGASDTPQLRPSSFAFRTPHSQRVTSLNDLKEWYLHSYFSEVGAAYEALRRIMVMHLAYDGDYGSRQFVPPRILLEMVDQYRIRRAKMPPQVLIDDLDEQVAGALLPGLRALLDTGGFLSEYVLYAPETRQLLMGTKPATAMPPMTVPPDLLDAATLLLYPPGAAPDYTKRPTLGDERLPLFPLDPLLVYIQCGECDRYRVAALSEVVNGTPTYRGLDPNCGHRAIFTQKEN